MNLTAIQTTLENRKVGIAGAGGLGSNCAAALVRTGIGHLIVCDFDVVVESNLNRQFYFRDQLGLLKVDALRTNLLRINPGLDLVTYKVKIDAVNVGAIFNDVDVLVEAFDQAEEKVMIIETALEKWPLRPLVVGSGMAGYGNSNSLRMRSEDNLYICGDEYSEVGPDLPPLAPRVGMVANMMADTVLEILLNTH